MKTNECDGCIELRQLDFIQRIGRFGYWEYDPEEKSIALPQASLDLLASIVGSSLNAYRPFMGALCDVERKRFETALDQAVASRFALNIELELTSDGGKHSWIAVRGAPVEVEQSPFQFAGIFQDITNEKHREADHENVIMQLRALLDALPQGVSVIDKDLRLILWNRRFHEILDFPQNMVFRHARFEDFIRLNAARGEYGSGDPEEQVQSIVARAGEFLPHRFERQLTGGRTLLVEGFPFRSGGEISGFVTTYTDITDQKRTEEQLTRQRDVMKTIIDNFPGGISLCDTDLRFTNYNDQFMALLAFPPSLFAKGWVDFEDLARFNASRGEYGPGNADEQVQAVVARAHNFQAHRIERMRPDGRWLEIRGTPIASGGFVTSYIDITERKQAEQALKASEERWKFALEGANDGVWDWNFETGEVLYSKRWKAMFGFAEDEMGNTTSEWFHRVHPDDLPRITAIIQGHLCSQTQAPSVEYRMRCKDGSWQWTLGRGMVVSRNGDGEPLRLVGTNTDISARKQAELALLKSKQQYDDLASTIPVGIYILRSTPEGVSALDYASPRMATMLNMSGASLLEDNQAMFRVIHPDDLDGFTKLNQDGIQQRQPFDWKGRALIEGAVKWLHIESSPEPQENGDVLWHGLITDITESKRMEDQVRQLALYDTLTTLPNRRLLNERLSQTMAASKRSGCYGALMFLDLDNFKPLNDTHGHVVGDLLLIEAADRLKSCVREMDTVARFGGDEFVVMLSNLNADKAESTSQAAIVAEKIRTILSEPYRLTITHDGKKDVTVEHHCTASVGVVVFINHQGSQDDILKWADTAMYEAKKAGRNLIRFYGSKD